MLLRWLARLSRWRITITPDKCVQCRLCEDSCPFGAIEKPTAEQAGAVGGRDKKRLIFLAALLPVLMGGGGYLVSQLNVPLSRMHATVRLAERIQLEESGVVADTTDASDAFRTTGETIEQLYDEAFMIREQFVRGGWILGGFLGLVVGGKLIRLSVFRKRTDYTADRANCLACGRCFSYCPVERARRGEIKAGPGAGGDG